LEARPEDRGNVLKIGDYYFVVHVYSAPHTRSRAASNHRCAVLFRAMGAEVNLAALLDIVTYDSAIAMLSQVGAIA